MSFVSILTKPDSDRFRLVAGDDPVTTPHPPSEDGTFGDRAELVVYERQVPDAAAVLERIADLVATMGPQATHDDFPGPISLVTHAIEMTVMELWPPHPMRCPDCQHEFDAPYEDRHHMYLHCPRCHNPFLNPRWDSA